MTQSTDRFSGSINLPNHNAFDVLGDVLETLRFRGNIFFRSRLAAPWGMQLEPTMAPRFHIAMEGDCVIGVGEGNRQVPLKHREIAVLPHGDMHWIADQENRSLTPSKQAGEACELGNPLFQQGKITNKLICGIVNYDEAMAHPILDGLPDVMHFRDLDADAPVWLSVRLIDFEMESSHGRRNAVVDRLTEVLFLQLLYCYLDENPDVAGFLSALKNPRVRRLLELIHQRPEAPWTVEQLGEWVGMSRATVIRHFNNTVGMPPQEYIANWRMMKARNYIQHSALSSEDIADRLGFASARTLGKAFQRCFGSTPAQFRKQASLSGKE